MAWQTAGVLTSLALAAARGAGKLVARSAARLALRVWLRRRAREPVAPAPDLDELHDAPDPRPPVEIKPTLVAPFKGAVNVTSPWGPRTHPITGAAQHHNGADLVPADGEALGTPLVAVAAGVVDHVYRDHEVNGNAVVAVHRVPAHALPADLVADAAAVDGVVELMTSYVHLERMEVDEGDAFDVGELLGTMGATGRATAPHLHFGVRVAGPHGWLWVDPARLELW